MARTDAEIKTLFADEGLNDAIKLLSKNSYRVWDLLTALRGPDFRDTIDCLGYFQVKESTTAVIRYAIGGSSKSGYICLPDTIAKVEIRRMLRDYFQKIHSTDLGWEGKFHFVKHAMKAFEVLGLKWDELNEPTTLAPE